MRGRRGRPGLLGTVARTTVIAGTAQAVGGRVAHRQEQKSASQEPPAAPAPEAPAPTEIDVVTQLRQLAELAEQGIITPEEFAAKKAQLLGI
jgi:putative oligomerization/nucleic acid binding protein